MTSGFLRHHHRKLKWIPFILTLLLFSQMARSDYAVQVGVFRSSYYADNLMKSLRELGFPVEEGTMKSVSGNTLKVIVVGPYLDRETAEAALSKLKQAGHEGYVRSYEEAAGSAETRETIPQPRSPSSPPAEAVETHPAPSAAQAISPPPVEVKPSSPVPTPPQPAAVAKPPAKPKAPPPPPEPASINDLFSVNTRNDEAAVPRLTGFFQSELAYADVSPAHLSKFRNTLELASQGHLSNKMAWKLSGRAAYDAVFDLTDYYPSTVRDDQQLEASVRETYLDISAGDWDFRLGRQHIIWGEMVGLFFADVVSAKDLREFVLPEFDMIRIPQWAVRSEYFKGDFHGEAIWIPYPTYDEIGVPGAEFYPYPLPPPPGYGAIFADERRPAGNLSDSNYGLRLSYLTGGWDLSGFYYNSMDSSPTFFREVIAAPTPTYLYTPTHTRIQQIGGTFSKDIQGTILRGGELGEDIIGAVFKGEVVYTHDRWFNVNQVSDPDGVVRQDSLDYVLGIEYSLPQNSRLNLQFFQRWYPNHNPNIIPQRLESGASIYASTKLTDAIEANLMWIVGLNRNDWMARPKLIWTLDAHWRWVVGADYFNGASDGLFGRFADKDRFYTELRLIF